MRNALHTAVIAAVSSLTTAALFVACTVESPVRPTSAPPPPPQASPAAEAPSPSTSPGAPSSQASAPLFTATNASAQALPNGASPAVQIYRDNGASVVNITSIAVVATRQGQSQQPQGIGSGFMIDVDGRIVTNNHVVQDANQLTVTFADKSIVPAKLVGRDPDNDLAVIQVDPSGTDDQGGRVGDKLKPVRMGDSNGVTIGEYAVAIGSPLGLQQTVTQGIVSALRNPGEESQVPRQQLDLLGGAIQTDASINPGNSGGPLFNARGEVIGVNSAILSQSGGNEGIGFSIPINVVKRVAPELIRNGRYAHPLLGVTTISLSQIGQQAKQQLGIAANQKGLLVQDASAGSAQAGIRGGSRTVTVGGNQINTGGDIIVAIDSQPATTGGELRGYIENNKHPGDRVTLAVLRDGQRVDVPVTLSERPATNQ